MIFSWGYRLMTAFSQASETLGKYACSVKSIAGGIHSAESDDDPFDHLFRRPHAVFLCAVERRWSAPARAR